MRDGDLSPACPLLAIRQYPDGAMEGFYYSQCDYDARQGRSETTGHIVLSWGTCATRYRRSRFLRALQDGQTLMMKNACDLHGMCPYRIAE